jgi:hypothetical protein
MAAGIQTPNVARFTWRRVAPAHATKSLKKKFKGEMHSEIPTLHLHEFHEGMRTPAPDSTNT